MRPGPFFPAGRLFRSSAAETARFCYYLFPMNKASILAFIDDELERLKQVRQLLGAVEGNGRPAGRRGAWHMSAEARARISAAQKARWAKRKAGHNGSSGAPRRMSAEGRKRISDAQKKRWAAMKKK
jgi:phage gpG-like protein